jgi:hypothetical protein
MRRILLVILCCLVTSSATATVRTVGTGKDYSTLASCFAALVTGDTIETYGPYTENNQSLAPPAGVTTITWRHYGADYTFNGTGATSVWLTLAASNTAWNVNAMSATGRIVVTGYIGAQPFVINGASSTIGGFRLTANGAVGVYQLTVVSNANSVVLQDLLVDSPVNPAGSNWMGIYLGGGLGASVQNSTVENVTITGAGTTYLIGMSSTAASPLLTGITLRNVNTGASLYGFYGSGANDFATYLDSSAYALSAGGAIRVFFVSNRSATMQNLLAYGFSSPTTDRGIVYDGVQVHPILQNSNVQNCTVIGGEEGISMQSVPAAGGRFVTNCIAHNSTASEFYTVAGGVAGSSFNWATANRYSVNWPVSATDLNGDPLFRDEATLDYQLRWQPGIESPCVDTGAAIPTRLFDLAGQPMSGVALDRGCFEFQQIGAHDVRMPLTDKVLAATRDERLTR